MELTTPVGSFVGGVLIGLAITLLYLFSGRVAGISGIISSLLLRSQERLWRAIFLVGMLVGGFVLRAMTDGWHFEDTTQDTSLWIIVLAGLLVGAGTRLSNGCTSGHGVCGLARLSRRSIIATLSFVLMGMFSVAILRQMLGAI